MPPGYSISSAGKDPMRVSELLEGPVVSMRVDDTLEDAAKELDDSALADGARLDSTLPAEYMTPAPVTMSPNASPDEALAKMLEGGFRHIPIVVDDREVVGVLKLERLVGAVLWAAKTV